MDDRLNPPTIKSVAVGGRLPTPPCPEPQPRDHYKTFERQARIFASIVKQTTSYWFNAVGAKAAKGYASPVALTQLRRKLHEADVAWSAMRRTLVAMIDSLEQE